MTDVNERRDLMDIQPCTV
jgi:chromosome segregation ATPase